MQQTAKGSGFLKVTGILMIIGGIISILVSGLTILALVSDTTVGFLLKLFVAVMAETTPLFYVACALTLIGAIAELVAGIVGVKNCKLPEKAGTCMAMGVVVAVLSVTGNILSAVSGGEFSVFSLILGLVLPALYIFGAYKNKQA